MNIDLEDHWFVVAFRKDLVVGLVAKDSGHILEVNGLCFAAEDDNYLTAFVDRLTDQQGELVGINVSPVSDTAERLMLAVSAMPYVTVDSGALRIWFSEAPLDGVINSGEQAFGGQVFRSSTGEFALSIDAASLFTDSDKERLTKGHTKWATIRP